MIALSTRTKEAIKISLAMVIAYAIAMGMGWDKPFVAGITIATVALLTIGITLGRGIARSAGTLVGGVAALAILGLFPQERWLLLVSLSLYIGFCTYMMTGKTFRYFWFLCAMTPLIIMATATPPGSESAFQTAVTRTLETSMGALVYTLIAVFLWPRSSIGALNETSRKLWATQATLYRTYRGLMSGGKGKAGDSRPLRLQEVELLTQFETLLNAAEMDSYEVWEMRQQWRRFRDQSKALMETLERWRQSFAEIQPLPLTKLLPNLEAVCSELDQRFAQIEGMLADKEPARAPQPITLAVDKAEMRALTRFQEAAVVVTQSQLENLEHLSRSLFDGVAAIRGYPRQAAEASPETTRPSGLAIDPDRCRAGIMVVATLWIAFLLWVYIDPPGDAGFVMMAIVFALIIAFVPQASTLLLFLSWSFGIAFAGVLYVFVMPHLSGFGQLGPMIFGAFFVMSYLFGEPRQTVARLFCMVAFLIVISIDNQQTYSFSDYANTTAMLLLGLGLAVVTNYIPTSPRPEKVFLRLLHRFFRHAEFLTSGLGPDGKPNKSIAGRWKAVLYRNDLLDVPGKLAACSQQVDYRVLPDNSPEQVRALVTSLYALTNRIEDALEARVHVQADRLHKPLQDGLRAWHQVIEERLQRRADDPTQFIEPSAAVRDRLAARLAGLEAVVDEAAAQAGEGALGTEDLKHLLRLLGCYRGLTEAAIGYAELAESIHWARWREARF